MNLRMHPAVPYNNKCRLLLSYSNNQLMRSVLSEKALSNCSLNVGCGEHINNYISADEIIHHFNLIMQWSLAGHF